MEDNKTIDMEIQELRRQVESTKIKPVRRGKWIEFKRTYLECYCSICGWEVTEKSDFCPHCGANMYEMEGLYDDYDDYVTASTIIEAEEGEEA